MPYLRVDLDAKKKIPRVAKAAGVSPGDVSWGLLEIWELAWSEKRDVLTEAEATGCIGPEAIKQAMAEFGFLERVEAGWRVRGAERFLRVRKAQSEAGKAAASNLKQNQKGAGGVHRLYPEVEPEVEPAGDGGVHRLEPETNTGSYTQHPTPSTIYKPPRIKRAAEENTPDPRHTPVKLRLMQIYLDVFGSKYPFNSREAKAVTKLLAMGDDEEITGRWRAALGRSDYPTVRQIHELADNWAHFAKTKPSYVPLEHRPSRIL